jgi:type I restriction enzyme S subunit
MGVNWSLTTIGDLCDRGAAFIQTGPFGSQLHSHEYRLAGTPVIPTEAIGRRRIENVDLPKVDSDVVTRLARHRLVAGDILFARRGAQATGSSAIVSKSLEGALCGTGAILLRTEDPKQVDPTFLSFALSAPSAMQWLRDHAVGAVMPNLNTDVIRRLAIPLPPLREQLTIASILSALDDKIELNRKMNETLEAMARALFRSWFVDFDPVRAKAAGKSGMDAETAKLFPSKFVQSELGEVPEGWSTGTLGDVAEHPRRGVQPDQITPGTAYIALEHMPRHCIALSDWGIANDLESNKFEFRKGEILFGKLRPYFHKVGVTPVGGVCSTDIVVVCPKVGSCFGLVLGHVSSTEFVEYTNAGSTGTKMPRTSWNEMARYEIAIPPEEVAATFDRKVRQWTERIVSNIHETRALAAMRDALLPKLLSGDLKVKAGEA